MRDLYRYYARVSGAVFLKLLLAYGGFRLGEALDRHFSTGPYLMFAGFVLGVALGLWWLIRTASRE